MDAVGLRFLPKEEEMSLAADITAVAFAESPFYSYIFQEPSTRVNALTWLFKQNFRMRANQGVLRGAFSGEKMVCCFLLVPENAAPVTFWDMLRHGLLEMPFRFGLSSVRRMLAVMQWTDKSLDALKQEHPKHFLLERMVVLPDCQGQGIGTAALTMALKEADGSGRAVLCLQGTLL